MMAHRLKCFFFVIRFIVLVHFVVIILVFPDLCRDMLILGRSFESYCRSDNLFFV